MAVAPIGLGTSASLPDISQIAEKNSVAKVKLAWLRESAPPCGVTLIGADGSYRPEADIRSSEGPTRCCVQFYLGLLAGPSHPKIKSHLGG